MLARRALLCLRRRRGRLALAALALGAAACAVVALRAAQPPAGARPAPPTPRAEELDDAGAPPEAAEEYELRQGPGAAFRQWRVRSRPERGAPVVRTLSADERLLVLPGASGAPPDWLRVAPGSGGGWVLAAAGGARWVPAAVRRPRGGDAAGGAQAAAVAAAFRDSWAAYRKWAWGADELVPARQSARDWLVTARSSGLTIIDALTTALVMGEHEAADEALAWIREGHAMVPPQGGGEATVNVFECTIRVVGGLVSAYELLGEREALLVERAAALARVLLAAYNSTKTGVPVTYVDLASGRAWAQSGDPARPRRRTDGGAIIAEAGGQSLELRTLTRHSGDATFDRWATWAGDILTGRCPGPGALCPNFYHPDWDVWLSRGRTLGAGADSYYEYLLKQHLLERGPGQGSEYWDRFLDAARGARRYLVRPLGGGALWLGFSAGPVHGGGLGEPEEEQEHLTCFAAGWYALGAMEAADPEARRELLATAEGLCAGCRLMYKAMRSGVGPERAGFSLCKNCPDTDRVGAVHANYALRPEYAEALFYLWRATGEERYRQWGWEAFRAINASCSLGPGRGFQQLREVNQDPALRDADLPMPSYWLAETLLYFWLLFSPESALSLNEWVFTTEGHPLRRRVDSDPRGLWPPAAAAEWGRQRSVPVAERLADFAKRPAGVPPFEPAPHG